MAEIVPIIQLQFFDNNGDPLTGGKIYCYEAGTTTPKVTYKDLAGTEPNTNPIILDSSGRPPYDVRSITGTYKFIIKDSNDNTLETYDDVQSFSGLINTAGALSIASNLSDLNDNDTAITNLETGATGGDIVQASRTQTLTNKTIDADNNTISNLAHGAEVDQPSSGVHGVNGSIVGTTDTQTLTSKTIVVANNTITTASSGNLSATELNNALSELQTDIDTRAVAADYIAKSALTAKGALISASASATPSILTVGADNTVLIADSAQAAGVKWGSVSGLSTLAVTSKTTTYTATTGDDVILCDTSGGAWTLTLYAASGNAGRQLRIKKTTNDFSALTIDGNASETIDGATTRKLITQYDEMTLVCDGSNWHILDRRYPKIWTSYTVAITGSSSNPTKATTPTSDVGQWMRSGDDEVSLRYTYFHSSATGAAAGSGNYSFSYPTGITTNATKVGSGTPVIGVGYVFTTAAFTGIAYAETSTLGLYVGNSSGAHVIAGSSTTALNNSTVQIGYEVRIPVSGWE